MPDVVLYESAEQIATITINRPDKRNAINGAVSEALRQACESIGGKLEAFYMAFGEADVVTILDLPDNVAASALSLAASATGLVRTRTTPLLTVEEVDKSLATTVRFRSAGA